VTQLPPEPGGRCAVAVVIPTCRRAALLERCLHALLAQDLPHDRFEIIVVDDGDDATTQALVQQLAATPGAPAMRCLHSPAGPCGGPAAARNAGWRATRAPLIAFTDDDTLPDADWLSCGVQAMRRGAAALAGRVRVPPPAGHAPTDHERNTQALAHAEFVTANAFVQRRALERVHGFDERFTRAWREDSDLQFRLLEARERVGRCDRAQVTHPVRPERWGVSLRQQRNTFFEPLLYKKHPLLYRERIRSSPPWNYYAIALLALLLPVLLLAGLPGAAIAAAVLLVFLILRFAVQRLRGAAHTPGHVGEMLVTSAVIPFLSIYWKLRGNWRFRVLML
jgi:glycosyltransferase involved in cell wall biosynthesis